MCGRSWLYSTLSPSSSNQHAQLIRNVRYLSFPSLYSINNNKPKAKVTCESNVGLAMQFLIGVSRSRSPILPISLHNATRVSLLNDHSTLTCRNMSARMIFRRFKHDIINDEAVALHTNYNPAFTPVVVY